MMVHQFRYPPLPVSVPFIIGEKHVCGDSSLQLRAELWRETVYTVVSAACPLIRPTKAAENAAPFRKFGRVSGAGIPAEAGFRAQN